MTTSPEQEEPDVAQPPVLSAMHVTATAVVTRPDGSTDEEDSL
jgi:hypothetical protein